MLYDADKVLEAATVRDEKDLLEAQRAVFLDPHDPEVVAAARRDGIAEDWIEAAQNSPCWELISRYEVALPLHPEYRTLPMVWYVPPLSPVVDVVTDSGNDGEDAPTLFHAIDKLRIPVEYLAGLFSAGDPAPVVASLQRLAAMRAHMRNVNLGLEQDPLIAESVGMDGETIEAMYRLLAIAKYEDRYVIPTAHAETARELEMLGLDKLDSGCSLDHEGGPGMGGPRFGSSSGTPLRATVESFHVLQERQTADAIGETRSRVNLLTWDGKGTPPGMFPEREGTPHAHGDAPGAPDPDGATPPPGPEPAEGPDVGPDPGASSLPEGGPRL